MVVVPCSPAGALLGPGTKKLGVSALVVKPFRSERLRQFIKFCLVGASGTVVDMAVLYLLADPKSLGLNVTISKFCAAEMALINNFVWNELWTFRPSAPFRYGGAASSPVSQPLGSLALQGSLRRFLGFNAICGAGIVFAELLLNFFHALLGWNLYLSNLLAIGVVTLWNFGMNARFNWRLQRSREGGRR